MITISVALVVIVCALRAGGLNFDSRICLCMFHGIHDTGEILVG